jgi:hypothetical protein
VEVLGNRQTPGESLGERLLEEVNGKRESSGRVAGRIPAENATRRVNCLVRESLGKSLAYSRWNSCSIFMSSRPLKKLLLPSHLLDGIADCRKNAIRSRWTLCESTITRHAPSQHQPASKVSSAADAKAKELLMENPEFDPLENDFRGDIHNYSERTSLTTNDDRRLASRP